MQVGYVEIGRLFWLSPARQHEETEREIAADCRCRPSEISRGLPVTESQGRCGIPTSSCLLVLLCRTATHCSCRDPIIEGTTMNRDTYSNHGQAGAVGSNAHAHDMTFQQVQNQGAIDLPRLTEELARLRAAMKQETEGKPEQDEAIGEVAKAEKAAGQGDDRTALRHLKAAGAWTLGVAEKIGVPLAVEAIKRMM